MTQEELLALIDQAAAEGVKKLDLIDIGFSSQGRLLLVVYTERSSRIRLMSARLCTAKEARFYDPS